MVPSQTAVAPSLSEYTSTTRHQQENTEVSPLSLTHTAQKEYHKVVLSNCSRGIVDVRLTQDDYSLPKAHHGPLNDPCDIQTDFENLMVDNAHSSSMREIINF